jgi:hypothetical protein
MDYEHGAPREIPFKYYENIRYKFHKAKLSGILLSCRLRKGRPQMGSALMVCAGV